MREVNPDLCPHPNPLPEGEGKFAELKLQIHIPLSFFVASVESAQRTALSTFPRFLPPRLESLWAMNFRFKMDFVRCSKKPKRRIGFYP